MEKFCENFALILPTNAKFSQTTFVRVYYDLLRIFANALEVENSVLITFGFSFSDAHILDIVTRGLKNPTLMLLIIAFDAASVTTYHEKFKRYNNVIIIQPEGSETISFSKFNELLKSVLPKSSM